MKNITISEEKLIDVIKSALNQSSHQQPSPITLERMAKIEDMIKDHAYDETAILEDIKRSVAEMKDDQNVKHQSIENQLNEIKPLRDGLIAAGTLRSGVLWLSGFIIGITAIIYSWKQILR